MRQVPAFGSDPIGIVGDGRVARHFLHYFNLLGCSVRSWSRRSADIGPIDTLAPCRTVLLLIQDSAIGPFIDRWAQLREKRLVHFSGSLVIEAAEGAHPLMTFGPDLYELEKYRRIPFVVEEGRTPFAELLPALPNPSFTIPAADRPYYHALAVMAGNFSTVLWQKLFAEFERRFAIPAAAVHPYLSQVTANLLNDAGGALTGPLARGDVQTLAANLEALEGDPFQAVYAAFVRAYEHRS